MKKGFFLGLVLVLLICSVAVAGPPDIEGTWNGSVTSIVCCQSQDVNKEPPCESIDIGAEVYINMQKGNLFWGYFEADDYEHPCWGEIERQSALLTGSISVDKKISGTIVVPGDYFNNFESIGVFEGKWNGKKMEAVLHDFTDGSTSAGVFTKE